MPGMYVRVPVDVERTDNNFRDYRIGQLSSINVLAQTGVIHFHGHVEDESDEIECQLEYIDRCFILPDTSCVLAHNGQSGRILYRCCDMFVPGTFVEYYIQLADSVGVIRICESDLHVLRNRQDYDPRAQLLRYELQQPVWKFPRDRLIEVYSELHNATFGLEELVSARLMLFSHQAETIARVLADTNCRYILADEVGLGKTIEACVILKGLRRRFPKLRVLIIAPSSLAQQWHNELSAKFWLNFPVARTALEVASSETGSYILCAEDITSEDSTLWDEVRKQQWGLLIIDEAHHSIKQPILYERIRQLSAAITRSLVLSATPIQRRKQEYLSLLSLMNPHRYRSEDTESFSTLLEAQQTLLKRIAILTDILRGDFDADEFMDELSPVLKLLRRDQQLIDLANHIERTSHGKGGGRSAAREVLAYLGENYRIERRVIRNRRAHLDVDFPQRSLDVSYSYSPDIIEAETLDILFEYLELYIRQFANDLLAPEYARIWMHASASSPHALLDIIETRLAYLVAPPDTLSWSDLTQFLMPATPRQEFQRVENILAHAPSFAGEKEQFIEPLLRATERWMKQTQILLDKAAQDLSGTFRTASHRLLQVLQAVHVAMTSDPRTKVILFSGWSSTLDALLPSLRKRYGQQALTRFTGELADDQLQANADIFQGNSACRILLCDELGGEGRNFQIADQIVHIDLPWTPALVEQRIGRIDRIGRTGDVLSVVPYAYDWPEEALFRLWQDAFHLFTRSMSGLEIALEGVQDELLSAIQHNPRRGLEQLLKGMVERAERLREEVEEERYYEEVTINHHLRDEFRGLSDKYRDGKLLQDACLRWAGLAGLHIDANSQGAIIRFNPREFSLGSMKKAKFLQVPNMEEALVRSGRQRNLVISGTFDRDVAVRREDLVFFAPGSDPWVDAIIANALEADTGRCCAILRRAPGLKKTWRGFEFLYSFTVDPRPLYQHGYDPTHLFQAFSFLRTSTFRLLLSEQGQRESNSSLVGKLVQEKFSKRDMLHLGQRSGTPSPIQAFKEQNPIDAWRITVERAFARAEEILSEELDEYMEEVSEEALDAFDRQVLGMRFASLWQQQHTGKPGVTTEELAMHNTISEALAEGLKHPVKRLESVCYWVLWGDDQNEHTFP